MAYGVVIKMHRYRYDTPNQGTLVDLETGLEYTFVRPNPTTFPVSKWNVKLYDGVSFTLSGGVATNVTLLKKHGDNKVFSYKPSS